jgi:hypothetical protein
VRRALLPLGIVCLVGIVGACTLEQPNGLLSGGSTSATTGSSGKGSSGATTSASMTTSGSGTGGSGGMAQTASYAVSVDKPDASITLASELTLVVSVDPKGYVGNILLGATSLDGDGLTTKLDKTSLALDGSSIVKTNFTLTSASDTPPNTVGYTITAASEAGNATADGAVTVLSEITIVIPKNVIGLGGTAQNPYMTAFGPYPMKIVAPPGISAQNPVTVHFYNDDDASHEIHADQGPSGFGHDQASIPANSMDPMVREVNAAGTYDYYLHDQNAAATIGRIVIQ